MYFLDELDNLRLYRRSVLLPINEKDKKHTGLAYILSPDFQGTKNVFYNNLLLYSAVLWKISGYRPGASVLP